MVEFSKECQEKTSASSFIAGALAQGAVWAGYGAYIDKKMGAAGGALFGEAVNLVSFGMEYASCSFNGKSFGSNVLDLFRSSKEEKPKPGAENSLPKVSLE